jgi:DNA-binding NarL/FixJ family response regulator
VSISETSLESNGPVLQAAEAMTNGAARAIRLVLAGHHPLTLCGLAQVFEKEPDFQVLSVCSNVDSTLQAVRRLQPDIVRLDLDVNDTFTVLRRIQRERLQGHVVVLAAASDNNEILDAARLGARAVVLKEWPPETFVSCVRKVYDGDLALDSPTSNVLVPRLSRGRATQRHAARQLTPREAEIARLAVRGVSTREIAARLDVKQGTVKIHLHSIYDKLNVAGRLGLILVARRHGLA